MPTFATLRPLSRFALDAAVNTALGAIPVGRLRGGQVVALVAASAVVAAAGTYVALRARPRAGSATLDGWMPWTPHAQTAQAAPTAAAGTAGEGARSRREEDRRVLLRRSVIAAVAGTVSGGVTAFGVAADRRMEALFTDRGVRYPRLAVGLSQGVGYAALTALLAAAVDIREQPEGPAGRAPIRLSD